MPKNAKKTQFDYCMDELMDVADKLENVYAELNRTKCADCPDAGPGKGFQIKEKGCCSACAGNHGYLTAKDFGKRTGETYFPTSVFEKTRSLFEKKHNFQAYNSELGSAGSHGYFDIVNHRCGLPRHLRSRTCLSYCCDPTTKSKAFPYIVMLMALRQELTYDLYGKED